MILFDGAMGTMLQQAGLPAGACPEAWCLVKPEQITAIHEQLAPTVSSWRITA